jgi:stearoyl-CoA desaturase (Delta-9 desaturase)
MFSPPLLDGFPASSRGAKPMLEAAQPVSAIVVLWIFVLAPFLALLAAVPLAGG